MRAAQHLRDTSTRGGPMKSAAVRALLRADSRTLARDPLLGWVVRLALLLRVQVSRIESALLAAAGISRRTDKRSGG